MRVQGEEIGQDSIPAVSETDGFQSGVKTPLLFIQQAVEQQDRGLELLGRHQESFRIGGDGNGLCGLPCPELLAMVERVGARVEVAAIKRGPLNAALLMQSTQDIVDLGVDRVGEFAGVESLRGPLDNSLAPAAGRFRSVAARIAG